MHPQSDGFAAAVHPVSASAIFTADTGLTAGPVEIPAGDVKLPGYRAKPSAGSSFPVMLVVQEIFGVHEYIKDLCRRLAHKGYLAVAPELYFRQGDVSRIQDFQEIMQTVVSKVPDAQVLSDLDATVAWARKNSGDANRLGITGFCWGGRITWLYAAHRSDLQAAAAWYGRLAGQHSSVTPKHPVDVAGELKCPVIGFYGGQDQGIPLDTVDRMQEALQKGGKMAEIHVYPNAGHAFHADYRPSYEPVSAKDAWKRMLKFFGHNGVI